MRRIFDYKSYRELLNDLLNAKGITRSKIAELLGLRSKSYIGLILAGKRNLQVDQTYTLKEALGLSASEFEYLFHLVLFNDTASRTAQVFHRRKLDELKKQHRNSENVTLANESVLSRWFYPLLILATTLETPLSPRELAARTGLKEEQIEAAYRELEDQGLLRRDASEPPAIRLKIAKKNWNVIQRQFLKDQIGRSLAIFDQSYDKSGKFYSQSLTLSKKGFDAMWESLKATMDDLADQSDAETPEELVQLNLQFYRLV